MLAYKKLIKVRLFGPGNVTETQLRGHRKDKLGSETGSLTIPADEFCGQPEKWSIFIRQCERFLEFEERMWERS